MKVKSAESFTFFQISVSISLVLSATILSFREYFLINPFAGNIGIISLLQAGSLVALLGLVLVPPYLFSGPSNWTKRQLNVFLLSAVAWPVSLMLVRVAIWRTTGLFVVDYWLSYPILFVCEFGASATYIYLLIVLKSKNQGVITEGHHESGQHRV